MQGASTSVHMPIRRWLQGFRVGRCFWDGEWSFWSLAKVGRRMSGVEGICDSGLPFLVNSRGVRSRYLWNGIDQEGPSRWAGGCALYTWSTSVGVGKLKYLINSLV